MDVKKAPIMAGEPLVSLYHHHHHHHVYYYYYYY